MAEEHQKAVGGGHEEVEVQDQGLFNFMGKKMDEERKEEVLVTGVEKIHIEDQDGEKTEEKKEGTLLEKLHHSHSSSSSSSSDEEEEVEGENKEKKIKKKGLKEKLKEKLGCEKKADGEEDGKKPEEVLQVEQEVVAAAVVSNEDTAVVVEKVDAVTVESTPAEEDKKGLLDKIKEKLPSHKKPVEEVPAPAAPPAVYAVDHGKAHEAADGNEGKEKKGIVGKIMEELPGYHKTEEKEGEKSS